MDKNTNYDSLYMKDERGCISQRKYWVAIVGFFFCAEESKPEINNRITISEEKAKSKSQSQLSLASISINSQKVYIRNHQGIVRELALNESFTAAERIYKKKIAVFVCIIISFAIN